MAAVTPASSSTVIWNKSKGVRILDNLVATTPYSIGVASLYASLVTQDPTGMYVLAIVILTEVLNGLVIKPGAKKLFGESATKRPNGNSNVSFGNNPKGCGIYYEGKTSTSSGMPSGHAQYMGTFGVFFTLYIIGKIKREKLKNENADISKYIASLIGIWVIAAVVICHRSSLWSGCHSAAQLFVGFCLGGGLGTGFYAACSAMDETLFPKVF